MLMCINRAIRERRVRVVLMEMTVNR